MPQSAILTIALVSAWAAPLAWGTEYLFAPRPGPLDSVHPGFELATLLPGGDSLKVVGMDWLPGGDMAILAMELIWTGCSVRSGPRAHLIGTRSEH